MQAIEPTPRLPDHTGFAARPGLRSDPVEDLKPVIEFGFGVFVRHYACRISAAAHINADAGVAGASELGMNRLIASSGHVVLAVRDVFQDGWHLAVFEVVLQPDPGGEFDSVCQGDARVLNDVHTPWVSAVSVGGLVFVAGRECSHGINWLFCTCVLVRRGCCHSARG